MFRRLLSHNIFKEFFLYNGCRSVSCLDRGNLRFFFILFQFEFLHWLFMLFALIFSLLWRIISCCRLFIIHEFSGSSLSRDFLDFFRFSLRAWPFFLARVFIKSICSLSLNLYSFMKIYGILGCYVTEIGLCSLNSHFMAYLKRSLCSHIAGRSFICLNWCFSFWFLDFYFMRVFFIDMLNRLFYLSTHFIINSLWSLSSHISSRMCLRSHTPRLRYVTLCPHILVRWHRWLKKYLRM